MITTTTPTVEGKKIDEYLGIVMSENVAGVNVVRDVFASFRDFFGGRSAGYEKEIRKAQAEVLRELEERAGQIGADAIVGMDLDYEAIGTGGMIMVTASGTAVKLR